MPQSRPVTITTVKGTLFEERNDAVATEEPLEIWLGTVLQPAISLAITMRTPGQDRELAAGFLWGEGIVSDPQQIVRVVSDGAIRPGRIHQSCFGNCARGCTAGTGHIPAILYDFLLWCLRQSVPGSHRIATTI